MRKNIASVIDAFHNGESHREKTCHTDGTYVFSYAMPIGKRLENGTVQVVSRDKAPSNTTRSQVDALRRSFPNHETVDNIE